MNRITKLFKIRYPIVQGGMVWCSGYKLASAVSNSGGLGLIGAGSMTPDLLEYHIKKCGESTDKPFGVNLPLLYSHVEEQIDVILRTGVKIVFTSAGNPAKYTSLLKHNGITVVHVIANRKFALKAADAGVDAIVAEGFEAGGHDGAEETTSFVLIPLIRETVELPLIAAGGIASGKAMLAAFALGANIMICSNSVVTGEVSMIRKHTGTANQILTYGISEGIKQLGDNFLSIEKQLEEMKQIEISKRICAELVGRLYLEEEIITAHQLSAIKGELSFESYDYGVKDTLFNLYQATTHAMKSSHPRTFLTDHIDAHSFFTSQAGIIVPTKTINVESYSPFKQLDLFEELYQ